MNWKWLRPPTRLEAILVAAISGVANIPFAIQPGHYFNDFAVGICGGLAITQAIMAIASSRRKTPSSPSQQPTSGTSPNPNLSLFQTGGIISWNQTPIISPHSPSPSEKPSPPKFPLEKRNVPVVGFRSWLVSEAFKLGVGPSSQIGAINRSYGEWKPGVNVAKCHARDFNYVRFATGYEGDPVRHQHYPTAPDPTCTCGYYVLTNLDQVPYRWSRSSSSFNGPSVLEEIGIVGAVVGWGRVVQHGDEGWRAEKVQVIALLDCKLSDEHLAQTKRVAAIYGVPVVGRTALELLAKEYGDRLPAEVTG